MKTAVTIIKVIGVIAGILAALAAVISYITYRFAFFNANKEPDDPHRVPSGPKYDCLKKEIHELIDETLAIPYEEVHITSRDGLPLYAKLYRPSSYRNDAHSGKEYGAPASVRPPEGTVRVALLMHGWRGIAERDFAGGVQAHLERGDTVLLVDERAHGKSGGHTITFGVKERFDCLDWIDYILRTFGKDTPIILHGVSMGASVVMMAAGLDLPENVRGIIMDSGYTTPKEIICKVVEDKKVNPRIAWPFIKLGAFLFGHFDPEAAGADAYASMKKNHLPALFIHGTGDDFVPFEMGEANCRASKGPKFFTKVEGAPHVMAYMYDKELYFQQFDAFYNALDQ